MQNTEKKKMIIFLLISFGLTYLMAVPMYFGIKNDCDISTFPVAQMMYPACGVIAGILFTSERKEKKYPLPAYIIILAFSAVAVLCSLLSVIFPLKNLPLPGMEISPYNLLLQVIIIPVSVAVFILFCVCSKEAKSSAGIQHKNMGKGALIIVLFLVLYFARIFLSFGLEEIFYHDGKEEMTDWLSKMLTPVTAAGLISTVLNYFLTFILFFGEEYGWRFFLQPGLQKKFGLKRGVLLLGLVWGLWHMPMDFMYYTRTTGLQMQVNQIITCTAYAVFFGYAYMKTQNIWVPVIIHYLNNNLVPVIEANYSADVLENQSVEWSDIPVQLLLMIFYFLFIFAGEYRKKSGTVTEQTDTYKGTAEEGNND